MWLKKLFAKPSPAPKATVPTPDAAAVAEAKQNPNGWVYAMDGIADPKGAVSPERIRGAWKVNANGEIEGEFIPNPAFDRDHNGPCDSIAGGRPRSVKVGPLRSRCLP